MRLRALSLALLTATSGACARPTERIALSFPTDQLTGTEILALRIGRDWKLFVVNLAGPGLDLPWTLEPDEDGELFAILLLDPPEHDLLSEGPLPTVESGGRPLPDGFVYRLELRGAHPSGDWMPSQPSDELRALRIEDREPSPIACADGGGCYASTTSTCSTPCPFALPMPEPPAPPEPPHPPALPHSLPCLDGWSPVPILDGPVLCEPWPSGQTITCPDGQARWPSRSDCAPLLFPCPTGQWPENLPSDREKVFVDFSATPGGTGTQISPFQRIEDALANISDGGLIVLAKGEHPLSNLVLDRPLSIRGACAAETRLGPAGPMIGALITVAAPAVELQDLELRDAFDAVALESGSLTLTGVEFKDSAGSALVLHGGALAAESVRIAGTGTVAVQISGPARVQASQLSVESAAARAVLVENGGGLELADFAVLHTISPAAGFGTALGLRSGATATVATGLIEDAAYGVELSGEDTRLDLLSVLIRDLSSSPGGTPQRGIGIRAAEGAALELSGTQISGAPSLGLLLEGAQAHAAHLSVRDINLEQRPGVYGMGILLLDRSHLSGGPVFIRGTTRRALESAGARVELTDVTVRGVDPDPANADEGGGLAVFSGSRARFSRVLVDSVRFIGVDIRGPHAHASIEDLLARDITDTAATRLPSGVHCESGGSVFLERATLEHMDGSAIVLRSETSTAATAELYDLSIDDLRAPQFMGSSYHAYGIAVGSSATEDVPVSLTLARARIQRVQGAAMIARRGHITLDDLQVLEVGPRGIELDGIADITGSRFAFERVTDSGLWMTGNYARATLDNVVMRNLSCGEPCAAGEGGIGFYQLEGPELNLRTFEIDSATFCGVYVFSAYVELSDGFIHGSDRGTGICANGAELRPLTVRVHFSGNHSNISP